MSILPIVKNENGEYYCRYEYKGRKIFSDTIINAEAKQRIKSADCVQLKSEPKNEYDSNTVAVYVDDVKIGYIFKGNLQDMLNDYLAADNRKYPFAAIDANNEDGIFLRIAFFHKINGYDEYRLTGTGSERAQEDISFLRKDEKLEVEYDYDKEQYSVLLGMNNTKAFLPKKIENINEHDGAFVSRIESDGEKQTVYVKFFK